MADGINCEVTLITINGQEKMLSGYSKPYTFIVQH